MPRYLGIDYGGKRIGLAVSDPVGKLASPLTTLPASSTMTECVRSVMDVAEEYDVAAFVVGLPLNMDGSEGPQAWRTRRFGTELARVARKPVHYWDERLSSQTAAELLQPADLTRKKRKARLDRVAALVILQDFLDRRP